MFINSLSLLSSVFVIDSISKTCKEIEVCFSGKVYEFDDGKQNEKKQNYDDNQDEKNIVTGNKKYIKYSIDPFDINDMDIVRTWNNNSQNNTVREWSPNDINVNSDINNGHDVIQNMYNNKARNINNYVNNIKYLKK